VRHDWRDRCRRRPSGARARSLTTACKVARGTFVVFTCSSAREAAGCDIDRRSHCSTSVGYSWDRLRAESHAIWTPMNDCWHGTRLSPSHGPMCGCARLLISRGRRVQTLTGLRTASAGEALRSRLIRLWSHSEPLSLGPVGPDGIMSVVVHAGPTITHPSAGVVGSAGARQACFPLSDPGSFPPHQLSESAAQIRLRLSSPDPSAKAATTSASSAPEPSPVARSPVPPGEARDSSPRAVDACRTG
jgi:hypothetical protein